MATQRLSQRVKQNFNDLMKALLKSGIGNLRDDAFAGLDWGEQINAESDGVFSSARLKIGADPGNTETVTIGGHEFRFLTTLVAANTYTQVKRGVSAAATIAALLDAINGVTNANVVPATTPFAGLVYADQIDSTHIRVRQSETQGAVPLVPQAPASVALTSTLSNSGDVWNCANMNVSGQAPSVGQRQTHGRLTITAAMATYTSFQIELPFTIGRLIWDCYQSTGAKRAATDVVTFSGNTLTIGIGGASIAAGDVIDFIAAE